jgi:hypothetical protein
MTRQLNVWDVLPLCPPDAVRWAALAYYAGTVDARASLAEDIKSAGTACATDATANIWPRRLHADTVGRREASHEPCGLVPCRDEPKCARCVHAHAYARRGGRDYPGAVGPQGQAMAS